MSKEKSGHLQTKMLLGFDSLLPEDIQSWRELERRAKHQNAYLGIDYLLPYFKFVHKSSPVIIFIYDCKTERQSLVGVGVFFRRKKLGIPYLVSVKTNYIFNSGCLVDKALSDDDCVLLIEKIFATANVEIVIFKKTTNQFFTESLLKSHLYFLSASKIQQAVLLDEQAGEEKLAEEMSKNRRKEIRRKTKKLEELGVLSWRVVQPNEIRAEHSNKFLALENDGWKGESGTSIQSNNDLKQFFNNVVDRLKVREMVFFTELCLNDEVIASTCNFRSGNTGFAFKLGWKQDYEKYSIGMLNEYFIAKQIFSELPNLKCIDGGTEPSSFLSSFWKGVDNYEDRIVTRSLILHLGARVFLTGKKLARKLRQILPTFSAKQ